MYRKNTDTCKYPYIFGLGQKKEKKKVEQQVARVKLCSNSYYGLR